MHETIKKMIHSFEKQREQRRRVYAAFTALAILVSVSTTYLLVQPASTMAADYTCGMKEHIHTEDCYEDVLICGHGDSAGGASRTEAPVEEELPEEEVIQGTPSEDVSIPEEEVETPTAPSEDETPAQQQQPVETTPEPSVEAPESEESVTETSPAPEETPAVEESTEETSNEEPAEESAVQETPAASEPAAEEPENDTSDSGTIEESLVMNSYGPENSGDSADEEPAESSEPAEESDAGEPADAEETHDADDEESETVSEDIEDASEDAEDASEDTEDADEEAGEASEEESDSAGGHVHTQACYKKVLVCGKEEHVHDESCLSLMMLLPEGAEIPEGYDQEYSYIDSDNRFMVAVYAPDGALPEGAQLVAELLEEGSDAHAVAEEALAAMAAKEIEVNVGGVMSEAALEEAAANVSAEPEEEQQASVEVPAADEAEAAVEAESADTSESAELAEDSGESVESSSEEQETEMMDEEPADVEPSDESEGTMTASLIHNDAAPGEETAEPVEETTEPDGETEEPVEETAEEITEAVEEEEEPASYEEEFTYDGFVALDIHFELDGDEIEPAKPVFVCINVKGLLPEEADPDSVMILHQKEAVTETEESMVESVEVVADSTEATGVVATAESYTEEALDVTALFAVDSFSTFIATYLEGNTLVKAVTAMITDKIETPIAAGETPVTADVWQIYYLYTQLSTTNQKKVTNRTVLTDFVKTLSTVNTSILPKNNPLFGDSDTSYIRNGGGAILKFGDTNQQKTPNVAICGMSHTHTQSCYLIQVDQTLPSEYGANGLTLGLVEAESIEVNVPKYVNTIAEEDLPTKKWADAIDASFVLKSTTANSPEDTALFYTIRENFYVRYNNVGMYNGEIIDVKVSIANYKGSEPSIEEKEAFKLGLVTDGTGIDGFTGYKNKPGLWARSTAWAKLKYEFFIHGTDTPISVKGSTSYYDLDAKQAVFMDETCKGIYVTKNEGAECSLYFGQGTVDKTTGYGVYSNVLESADDTLGATSEFAFTEVFDTGETNYMYRFFSFDDSIEGYDADGKRVGITANGHIYHDGLPVVREGTVVVKKAVTTAPGGTIDTSKAFDFTFELSDTSINGTYGDLTFKKGVATFQLKHGEAVQATGLPVGVTYTITETPCDDYTTTVNGNDTNVFTGTTLANNEIKEIPTANYVNELKTGDLVIQKEVYTNDTLDNDGHGPFTFEVSCTALGDEDYVITNSEGDTVGTADFTDGVATVSVTPGEPITVNDLPGNVQIVVSESSHNGYSVSWSTDGTTFTNGDTASAVTIPAGSSVSVYFRNTTGPMLPSTGGIGTNHFTTLGIVTMLGAGVLLLDQRRRREGPSAT